MNCFIEEFSSLLENYVIKSGSLLIAGDFNFHINDTSDVSMVNFINLLEAFNLRIHATRATHRAGHTLDLIITRIDDESFIHNIGVHDSMISDHFTLIYSLDIRKPCYVNDICLFLMIFHCMSLYSKLVPVLYGECECDLLLDSCKYDCYWAIFYYSATKDLKGTM